MQYPIIDLIMDAYINNGWTGLDISTGKNLFNINNIPSSGNVGGLSFTNDGEIISYQGNTTFDGWKTIYVFTLPVGEYYFSMDTTGNGMNWLRGYTNLGSSAYVNNTDESTTYRLSLPSTVGDTYYEGTGYNIQIEHGTERTPYEPYNPNPSNDFPNRLKLPLPHYFPHSVIDALQRAAAGTQTADDTEILRHYLTPLGIGGI